MDNAKKERKTTIANNKSKVHVKNIFVYHLQVHSPKDIPYKIFQYISWT